MLNAVKKLTSKRRWLWIAGGVLVIGIAVFAVTQITSRGGRRANAQNRAETTQVQTGDISGTVSASGHLQAHQDVSLSLQATGVVKEVDVKVGDTVKAGTVLIKLDDTDAQRSVQAAQNALEEAKLKAQAAQVSYASASGYKPSDSALASAIANSNNAAAAVQAAQTNYDKVAYKPWISSTAESLALAQATNNYNAAKASLDSLLSTHPDTATPKINLDLANLAVNDAQLSLDAAQSTLNKMTLVAPFDGTITAINTDVGATASGPVVEIISADQMEGLLSVGEIDMASLALNEPVTFTLDTWPGTTLTGEVIAIDPKPTTGTNADVVNYGVHISVKGNANLPLRDGMTINATITTFSLKGVLLVPNGSVTLGTDGKYYVNLITDGKPQKTEVKIGVHNTQYTQILSGLKAGDEIQVSGLAAPVRTGGGGFGGGGGPRVFPGG